MLQYSNPCKLCQQDRQHTGRERAGPQGGQQRHQSLTPVQVLLLEANRPKPQSSCYHFAEHISQIHAPHPLLNAQQKGDCSFVLISSKVLLHPRLEPHPQVHMFAISIYSSKHFQHINFFVKIAIRSTAYAMTKKGPMILNKTTFQSELLQL
jgi:hypothetical protein